MLASLLAFLVVSCQSGADNLGVEKATTTQPRATDQAGLPTETVGTGTLMVGMVTVALRQDADTQRHRDRIDGAKLAIEELSRKAVRLDVINTDGSATALEAAGRDLAARAPRMVIVSAGPTEAAAVRAGLGTDGPPVIALHSNQLPIGDGIYSFVPDRVDGVIEGASFALAKGKTRLVAALGPDASQAEADKITRELKPVGKVFAGTVRLDAGGRATDGAKSLTGADAVALIAAPDQVASLLAGPALSAVAAKAGAIIVIPPVSVIAQPLPARPADILFCRYEQEIQANVGSRFMRRFGRPVSVEAGHGYDAAALAIGISLSTGDARTMLTSPNGFNGSLGIFRFTDTRRIQRGCAIFKVQGRGIIPLHKAPPSF